MPRRRFFNLPREKRLQMLDVAAEEFAKHGFEGASYNRIIENTGMSKGAMYYYFNDKEDLYGAVIEDAFGRMAGRMAELFEGFSGVETHEGFFRELERLVREMKDYIKENSRDGELLKGLTRAESGTFQLQKLREIREGNRDFIVGLISTGQKIGAVRTDIPAELLAGILDAQDYALDKWLAERLDITSPEGVEQWGDAAVDLMMRTMLTPELLAARYRDDPVK